VHTLGYGARYSFSVIFPSLLEEFKWPRDTTAAMLSIHLLVYGVVSPLAGGMVDRVGPRKTMACGIVLMFLGLILSSCGYNPWHFYFSFGVLFGAGLCLIGSVPFTAVLRTWFERKRGLAFSVMYLGSGGAFVCYPAVAFLIDRLGWRSTFIVEAFIVSAAVIPLTIYVVRYHPREKGLVRDGILEDEDTHPTTEDKTPLIGDQTSASEDWTLPRAMKTLRFWLLSLTAFSVWGITQHILVAHQVAFAMDMGYSKLYASSVLSLIGITCACGSLAAVVSDRIGRELTLTTGTVIGISGILVLTLIKDTSRPWMLYYYSLSLGLCFGIASPTIAASITDIFQGPRVGSVIGFIWLCFAMGGTIGPWLGGRIFETTGSYRYAFILSMTLLAVSCVSLWLAAPRKSRPAMGKTHQDK